MKMKETEIRYEVVTISPAKAAKWLEGNVVNRDLRQHHIDWLARQMREGAWHLSNNAIAFDGSDPPVLLDGQHRLWAVIESGVTVKMLVGYGFDRRELQPIIDTGLKRTARDTAKIQGLGAVTHRQIAVTRTMMRWASGYHLPYVTNLEIVDYFRQVQPAIDFALSDCLRIDDKGREGSAPAGIAAVLAQAYYTAPHSDLATFGQIVLTGEPAPGVKASDGPLLLHAYIVRPVGQITQPGVYRRTQTALYAFLRQEVLPELYETREQRFPLTPAAGVPIAVTPIPKRK